MRSLRYLEINFDFCYWLLISLIYRHQRKVITIGLIVKMCIYIIKNSKIISILFQNFRQSLCLLSFSEFCFRKWINISFRELFFLRMLKNGSNKEKHLWQECIFLNSGRIKINLAVANQHCHGFQQIQFQKVASFIYRYRAPLALCILENIFLKN